MVGHIKGRMPCPSITPGFNRGYWHPPGMERCRRFPFLMGNPYRVDAPSLVTTPPDESGGYCWDSPTGYLLKYLLSCYVYIFKGFKLNFIKAKIYHDIAYF